MLTKKKLTKAQALRVRQAIERARLVGKCRYTCQTGAACIIGQLAVLEGV